MDITKFMKKFTLVLLTAIFFFSNVNQTSVEANPGLATIDEGSTLIPALVHGSTSRIYVHNPTNQMLTPTIYYYNEGTGAEIVQPLAAIAPGGTVEVVPGSGVTTASAVIKTASGVRLAAVVHNWYVAGDLTSNALSHSANASDASDEVYLPAVMKDAWAVWFSRVYVQNASNRPVSPTITLYHSDPNNGQTYGTPFCSWTANPIESGRLYVFDFRQSGGSCANTIPGSFAAKVTANGANLSVEVHHFHRTEPRFGSYKGSTRQTDSKLFLPVQFRKNWGWSTSFAVQSASATQASIEAKLLKASGESCTTPLPNTAATATRDYFFGGRRGDIPVENCSLHEAWNGSAILTNLNNGDIHAYINELPDNGTAAKGFRSLPGITRAASTSQVVLPFMPRNYAIPHVRPTAISASFTLQNLETEPVTVIFALYDQNGNAVPNTLCWESNTITLQPEQVARCYFGNPGSLFCQGPNPNQTCTLADGFYAMHFTATDSNAKIGAIGHIIAFAADFERGDWEMAYTGMP